MGRSDWRRSQPPSAPDAAVVDGAPADASGQLGSARRRAPALEILPPVPLWSILVIAIITFDIALAASYKLPVGALIILFAVTTGCGLWAYYQAGLMVASLMLLMLSLPFSVAFTRFAISPQETLLYLIWVIGALYHPLGTRQWLVRVFTSLSPMARFAILLFALAAAQSAFRLSNPNIIALTDSLRQSVVFPTLLAFIVAYAVRTHHCARMLLYAFAVSALLFALYALALRVLNVGLGNGSVAGRLGSEASVLIQYHPNNLGLYLALGLAFAPALVYSAARSRTLGEWKIAAIASAVTVTATALWLTYSRGALVALAAAGVVIVLGVVAGAKRQRRFIIPGAAVAGALAVLLLYLARHSLGRYAQLLSPGTLLSDPTVQFRLNLYLRAWAIIQAHPLTGIGFGGFAQGSAVPFSPHDTYLDILVATGVFGALGLLLVVGTGIVAAVRAALRLQRLRSPVDAMLMLSIAAALVAFLAQALTDTFTGNPRIFPAVWIFVACAEGTVLALGDRKRASASSARLAMMAADAAPVGAVSPAGHAAMQTPMGPVSGAPPHQQQQDDPLDVDTGEWGDWETDSGKELDWEDAGEEFDWQAEWDPAFDTSGEWPAIRPWDREFAAQREVPSEAPSRARDTGLARERVISQALLRRAPTSYAWNQAYFLWYLAMNFVLSVVIARHLSQRDYGIYTVLLTILTTLLFVFALGLEDVATVFLPRMLSRGGTGLAGALVRRLLLGRLQVLLVVGTLFVLLVPTGLALLTRVGVPIDLAVLNGPFGIRIRTILMAAYLVGNGLVSLESALFASVLRSRVTLIVGGCAQTFNVVLAVVVLALGGGIDGLLAVLAVVAWVTALAYLIPLSGLLLARRHHTMTEGRDITKLMISAWLTNVTNGALGKQSDILLMGAFAVSYVAIGNYNLAYQLANILGVLLISGLGGVGQATMSAALNAGGRERLASVWRTIMMLQVFLTVPILAIAIFRADTIITTLYGTRYSGAIVLLQVFLGATIIGRLVGGGVHQNALYVLGRQRLVLLICWLGLVVNITLDILLIPRFGPYGALAATSVTQIMVGGAQHVLVRRFLPVHYPLAFAIRMLGASVLATVCLVWWSPHTLVGLAVSSVGFIVILLIALFALGTSETPDIQSILELRPDVHARLTRLRDRLLGVRQGQHVSYASSEP